MICELTLKEYQEFLEEMPRYLFLQTPTFFQLKKGRKSNVLILGYKEDGKLLAAGIFYKLRMRKIFYSLECNFGPVYDLNHPEHYLAMAQDLLQWAKPFYRRIWRLRLVPFAQMYTYEDISQLAPDSFGQVLAKGLSDMNFVRYPKDFTEDSNIQARFMYVKDIADKSYKEVLSGCESNFRRNMNYYKKFGIRTKYLTSEEMPIFHRIMQATAERLQGVDSLNCSYIDDAVHYFGDNCRICVAYMNCRETLDVLHTEITALEKEELLCQQNIQKRQHESESLEGAVGAEDSVDAALLKRLKRVEELKRQLQGLRDRRAEVLQMQAESGNIVYMACGSFFYSASDVVYLQGGAIAQYMHFRPMYAIHEQMMQEAIARGVKIYNLFGITGGLDESASDFGVLEFKRKFRGRMEQMPGTFDYYRT